MRKEWEGIVGHRVESARWFSRIVVRIKGKHYRACLCLFPEKRRVHSCHLPYCQAYNFFSFWCQFLLNCLLISVNLRQPALAHVPTLPLLIVVQSLNCVQLLVSPWTAARQASLAFIISQNLVQLMSIELVIPSTHLVLCHPFLLLASIFLSIKVFFNEAVLLHQVAKVLELHRQSFREYSVLVSFRTDWFSIPAVQRALKSLLHHSSKASILQHSAFFMVQLMSVHDYWENHSFDYIDLCL